MTSTNSIGERGSPCLSPLAWQMRLPGSPFKRIFVLAVDRIAAIQSLHLAPKPKCCRTSSKKGQDTESKAFAMSIFNMTEGRRDPCSALQDKRTARKLSWMHRPLMNAL